MVGPIQDRPFSSLAQIVHAQEAHDAEQATIAKGRQRVKEDVAELKEYELWLDNFNQGFTDKRSHIQALLAKPVFSRAIGESEYTITVGDLLTDIAGNKLKEAGKDLKLPDVYNGKGIGSEVVDITGLEHDEAIAIIKALRILVQEGLIVGHCPVSVYICDEGGDEYRYKYFNQPDLEKLLKNGFKIFDDANYRRNVQSSDWWFFTAFKKESIRAHKGTISINAENSGELFWEKLADKGRNFIDKYIYPTWSVTQLGARAYAELLHPPQGKPLVDSSDYS